jgi:hypothetical protein
MARRANALAIVSVPQVILGAWAIAASLRLAGGGSAGGTRPPMVLRVLLPVVVIGPLLLALAMLILGHQDRDVLLTREDTRAATARMDPTWPLARWSERSAEGPIRLAHYVEACTPEGAHVLVTPYMPQVAALARRPFAGGHGDLRPDFFNTDTHQRLTIARLERQTVPLVIMPPRAEREGFARSFPLLDSYLRRRFSDAGSLDLGKGDSLELLVDRRLAPTGRYEPFGWPCYGEQARAR